MNKPTAEEVFAALVILVQYKLAEGKREDLIDFSLIQFGILERDARKRVMATAKELL